MIATKVVKTRCDLSVGSVVEGKKVIKIISRKILIDRGPGRKLYEFTIECEPIVFVVNSKRKTTPSGCGIRLAPSDAVWTLIRRVN